MNSPDSDSHPGRLYASRALVVLASIAVMLALVAAYARQAAVNSDQFANRATVALHDDSVRSLIAQKVTDELVLKNEADLIAARPIIESVASEIVRGRAFTNLFRKAVRDLHRALFKRDRNTVTLTLTDVGTVLAAALEQVRPALAEELQSTERVELIKSNIGSLSATLADVAETVELLALFLVLLSLVLVAGALVVAPDRRRGCCWWWPTRWLAGSPSTTSRSRTSRPPRARSGMRSWATCAPRPGSSRSPGPRWRPRRRR